MQFLPDYFMKLQCQLVYRIEVKSQVVDSKYVSQNIVAGRGDSGYGW